jgi:3-oxoadipate enol-lactonase
MRLAHRLDGPESRPVLVFGNSLGTTWELWDGQVAALADVWRIVRFDHPGHGRSPLPDGALTVESIADDVLGLVDELGLERLTFCGLSLGGAVGMAAARLAPDRIERLVLCCTSARFGEPEGWHDRARLVRAGGTAIVAERVLERWFTDGTRRTDTATAARFRTMLEAVPSEGYAACCEALALWDARGELGAISARTLVVAGERDIATPPADGAFLAESIPGAILTVLPGAAHLANIEQPELFERALVEFLSTPTSTEEAA